MWCISTKCVPSMKSCFTRSKQTAESKQTITLNKNSKFSHPTTLHCSSEAISQSMAKSKQTAEGKQTADLIKNPKFSCLTTLLSIYKL